jgi:hypothetical protein
LTNLQWQRKDNKAIVDIGRTRSLQVHNTGHMRRTKRQRDIYHQRMARFTAPKCMAKRAINKRNEGTVDAGFANGSQLVNDNKVVVVIAGSARPASRFLA